MLHAVIELLREAGSWRDAVATHDALPVVRADRSLLERRFQNLLDNALDYAGDAPARIHVTVEESQDEVVGGVRDHGIGVLLAAPRRRVEAVPLTAALVSRAAGDVAGAVYSDSTARGET